MRGTDIMGWTYDADVHCRDCARDTYGAKLDDDLNPPTDSVGDPVHPIFAIDEDPIGVHLW